MAVKLYVGNLSFNTTEETLEKTFSPFGTVISTTVITDRVTGRSKGFGFVEFDDDANAGKAIETLAGRELDGRKIRVNFAEERKSTNKAEMFRKDRTEDNSY